MMTDKTFFAAARLEDLPPGAKIVVEVGGISVLLCNTNDRIFAVRNLCSHAYETLECGRIRNGWISCPVHGARFDLETGAPINPPATMPIETYVVRVVGDFIEVEV
jgi:3-phenylpropionate/trans-cinnamate dioxygenase ferredoxin subunit